MLQTLYNSGNPPAEPALHWPVGLMITAHAKILAAYGNKELILKSNMVDSLPTELTCDLVTTLCSPIWDLMIAQCITSR